MRTLNRPMFNMGGPIKEGIMHGIREPYRHGRRVGYADGTPGWGGYFKNIFQKSKPVIKQVVGKKFKPIVGGINEQKWLEHLSKTAPKIKQTVSGITSSPAAQGFMKNLKDFSITTPGWLKTAGTGIKNIYASAPKKSLIGTTIAAPYAINLAKKIPFSKLGDVAKSYGEEWKKAFGIEEEKITDKDGVKGIEENITMLPPDTGSDYGQFDRAQKRIAEGKASRLAKQKKDDRINELLEIMGYDKSKKGAAYDALIDASQIISQAPGGEDLDISADIIQPTIAATSKRFDKPKDIEEAVRLMQTKADIQKDLTKDETALANELKREQIKVAKKTLAGPSLTEEYSAYNTKHGSYPTGDQLASMARTNGVDIESVVETKSVNSWLKNNKGKDIIDFMESRIKELKDKGTPIPAGAHVVKNRILIVDVNGNVTSGL
jgi:hypothetical protein